MEQSARLRQYNAWRRDNTGELPMPNPTEFGELLDGVADRLEVLERENAMLRKGDTCARMCEGTAYRIEARKLRTALARLAAAVGELPENGSGTVQGAELNAAYSGAMALLTTND